MSSVVLNIRYCYRDDTWYRMQEGEDGSVSGFYFYRKFGSDIRFSSNYSWGKEYVATLSGELEEVSEFMYIRALEGYYNESNSSK